MDSLVFAFHSICERDSPVWIHKFHVHISTVCTKECLIRLLLLVKALLKKTTDILIWCHFFLSLILATYNDYITLYFHFVIPFGFIFNFFITDIILLVIPRKKLMGFSLHYLGLWTVSIAILMIIYSLF